MDINDRDANFEKQEKTFTHLRESWKNISSGKQQVLTEGKAKDGFAVGKALKSKQKVKPMTEEVPTEVKKDEVIPAPEETPAPVSVDAPEVPPVDGTSLPPVDGAEVPPVETGLQPNPEKQVATQQFVQSALKGVTSGDADNKTLVTEFGFFKADVSDPANGQYVVIAYPADMKLKDIASVVEPVETPAEVAAAGDAEADEAGKVEPAPEDTASDLGGTPEDAASTDETKPEDDEMLKESVRDPISVGKKNWKTFLRKLLNEGTVLEESKKVEKEDKEEKTEVKEVCEEKEEKCEKEEKGEKEEVKELKEEDKEAEEKSEAPESEKSEVEEKGEAPESEKEEGETEEAKPEDLAAKKAQDAVLKEKLAEVKRLDVRVKSIQEQIKSIKTEYFEDEKIRQEMVEAYTKALAVANGALVSLKNSIEMMKS
jgi:hypothetical protein